MTIDPFMQNYLRGNQPSKRRVFFSFHYQEDINRVNIVRNSWLTKQGQDNKPLGFYDASLWESAQRKDAESLKDLIRGGVENTSVTAVLVGQYTFARRWVKYEIARSVVRGNGLVAVRVSGLRCMQTQLYGTPGPNPLDYVGVFQQENGQTILCEHNGSQWRAYGDHTIAVPWPKFLAPRKMVPVPLSAGTILYDYAQQNGYENFPGWVALAADSVGR